MGADRLRTSYKRTCCDVEAKNWKGHSECMQTGNKEISKKKIKKSKIKGRKSPPPLHSHAVIFSFGKWSHK